MGNCSSQGAKLSVQKFFKAVILTSSDPQTAEDIGTGNIEVTKYELVLHRKGMQTERWPYIFLTRCDYKGSLFRIETTNPHVSDKKIEFVFRVKHANLLLQRIQAQVVENSLTNKSATASGSKNSLLTSESDKSTPKENIDPDGVIYPSRMKRIEAELEAPEKHHFANLPDDQYTHPPHHISQPSFTPNLQQLQQQHLQQQRLQQQHYLQQQQLSAPPQQMFIQQQRTQLSHFINSRNTLTNHPINNNIYSDIYHNPLPSIHQPFYSEIPNDYLYPSIEEKHLVNNNFSKALKNNELKRKLCKKGVIEEEDEEESDDHQIKLCKKRSTACKRQKNKKPAHHFSNHPNYPNFNHHDNHHPHGSHHHDNGSLHNDSDDISILKESQIRRHDVSMNRSMYRSLDMLDIGRGNYDKKGPIHYL